MTDPDIPGTLTPSEDPQESTKWGKLVGLIPCLQNVELINDRFKVGRSTTCDVVIGNSIGQGIIGSISKEHFLIIKESSKVYLVDTSKNGTYKNGERIKKNEKTPLKDGDKIAIGSHSHHDLYETTVSVGRSSDCDISLSNAKIDPKIKAIFSKQQFVINKDCEKGVTFIKDLSTYGTYLNGVCIGKNKQNVLQRDDVIAIGKPDRNGEPKIFL
ncbi:unnamed protein product [Acanthoscelides obtectus]|uniref:FHA domain-containing protein n=1 Tax=Acanthoscelides obtectus TaxID=200917 RepID=A0A9P0VS36_ACAOB|nr:unnamed protein product [Acanthoscelides obtectus]CAK1688327.1 Serine/threonine-protein kinase Chk2 [Acanthoscelides obtectus]